MSWSSKTYAAVGTYLLAKLLRRSTAAAAAPEMHFTIPKQTFDITGVGNVSIRSYFTPKNNDSLMLFTFLRIWYFKPPVLIFNKKIWREIAFCR